MISPILDDAHDDALVFDYDCLQLNIMGSDDNCFPPTWNKLSNKLEKISEEFLPILLPVALRARD
jgi:hypothetical protein